MPILDRKQALLAKLETVYGIDPTPTGVANAMLVRNLNLTPMQLESEARGLKLPYLGNDESIVTVFYGMLDFEVEIAGAGAAGTVPKYGPLLRACGMAEVVSAGVSVTYTPISAAQESVTQYFYQDGLLHRFFGARGDVELGLNAKSIPVFKFKYMGLFQAVQDQALPTPTFGQTKPLAVNKANTTFTIHGVASPMTQLSLALKNDVKYRNLVGYEGVDIIDRAPDGQAEFEATLMATKNWFNVARDATLDTMALVHGTTAGNIVQINAPKVQITEPKYNENDGIVMLAAGLRLMPNAGNDEISIVVR
jgi:hypothetical protein